MLAGSALKAALAARLRMRLAAGGSPATWHDRRVYDCDSGSCLGRAVGEPFSDGVEGLIALRQDEEGQTIFTHALCGLVVLDKPPGREPAT